MMKVNNVNGCCTHSLTPWCRILFEKLIVAQLIKKYPAFFMETKGSSLFTKAHHWTLS
jgi:hypothetical protein